MKKPTNSPFNKLLRRGMFHIDDETLIAFLKDVLPDHEKENTKMHLKECSDCFMSMSVFQKSIQEKEELELVSTPEFLVEKAKALKPKQSILNQLRKIYKDYLQIRFIRIPAWGYGVSVTVITVALFLILSYPTPSIENYSMDERLLVWKTSVRGITEEPEIVKYKGMFVRLSEDNENLIFEWPEVAEAKFYDIYLHINGKRPRITPIDGIQQTKFMKSIEELLVQTKTKYTWEVTGKLQDGGSYQAKAAFIWHK